MKSVQQQTPDAATTIDDVLALLRDVVVRADGGSSVVELVLHRETVLDGLRDETQEQVRDVVGKIKFMKSELGNLLWRLEAPKPMSDETCRVIERMARVRGTTLDDLARSAGADPGALKKRDELPIMDALIAGRKSA